MQGQIHPLWTGGEGPVRLRQPAQEDPATKGLHFSASGLIMPTRNHLVAYGSQGMSHYQHSFILEANPDTGYAAQ